MEYRIKVELTLCLEGEYEDEDSTAGEQRAIREAERETRLNGTVIRKEVEVIGLEEKE